MHRKTQKLLLATSLSGAFVICGAGAMFGKGAQEGGKAQPFRRGTISPNDLQRLRWVEGVWRGTGCDGSIFFKRYHFEGDSRLVVETFSDEKLQKATKVIRFEIKDGRFVRMGEGPPVAATEVGQRSISFEATASEVYSYYWEYKSEGVWDVLAWIETGKGKANVAVFRMQRLEPPLHGSKGNAWILGPCSGWSPSGITTTWSTSTGTTMTHLTNGTVKAKKITEGY